MCGCLSLAPYWGPGPQPRHAPWLVIKLATLWFTGWHSVHWVTPARASPGVLYQSQGLIPTINGLTVILSSQNLTFSSSLLPPLSADTPQFNRRHHCRRCGRLVCSSCSAKKMVVEGCRENPTRVCDQCYSYYNKEWVFCSGAATVNWPLHPPASPYTPRRLTMKNVSNLEQLQKVLT